MKTISTQMTSWLSFLTMFVIGTDTFIIAPLLPLLSEKFSIPLDISGWMVSAYALGYAIFALISGPFSDRHNRKTILLVGLLGFAIATALCSFSHGFWDMIFFRFLAGVCAAFISPQIWASIPILVRNEHIVKTMGMASAGLAAAQLAGIPIGSFLAGISWHTPFYALSLATVALWYFLYLHFPSMQNTSTVSNKKNLFDPYREILSNTKLQWFLIAYLIFQTGNFAAISFYGTWLHQEYGLSINGIGMAMIFIGMGYMIGSLFGNRVVTYFGIPRSFFYGFITLILCYSIIPFTSNLYVSVVILSLIMIIAGFIFPLFMVTLQMQTTTARGTVSSLANAAMYVGTCIGGIVGGVLLTRISGFFGIAIFTVTFYLLSMFIYARYGAFKEVTQK